MKTRRQYSSACICLTLQLSNADYMHLFSHFASDHFKALVAADVLDGVCDSHFSKDKLITMSHQAPSLLYYEEFS